MNQLLILVASLVAVSSAHGNAVERHFGFFVGGYMPIAVNDEQLIDATEFAVRKINFAANNTLGANYYTRDKILYAMRQLVAGFNYKVAFLMDQSACAKADADLMECLYKGLHANNVNFAFKKVCIANLFQSFTSITGENSEQFQLNGFECY